MLDSFVGFPTVVFALSTGDKSASEVASRTMPQKKVSYVGNIYGKLCIVEILPVGCGGREGGVGVGPLGHVDFSMIILGVFQPQC